MIEFQGWPKTPRLFRDVIITEKIDGTNAAVIIEPGSPADIGYSNCTPVFVDGRWVKVGAQSRKRIITPDDDNFGFAQWVYDNAADLATALGEGYHYGEWWGSGIQRGYGLEKGEKRFSLFNVNRWTGDQLLDLVPGLGTVPVLGEGLLGDDLVDAVLDDLRIHGSFASPGFMNPEGICVFHTQSRQVYKVTLENDEAPKGLAA